MSGPTTHKAPDERHFDLFVRRSRTVSMSMTALMLVIYFGFIMLLAFGRDLLTARLESGLTVGIPLGIGIILSASLLTGIYVWWANTKYDSDVRTIVESMKGDDHA